MIGLVIRIHWFHSRAGLTANRGGSYVPGPSHANGPLWPCSGFSWRFHRMKHPKKWRSLIATGALAAVVSTVLVANAGEAAEAREARHGSRADWVGSWAAAVTRGNTSGSTFVGLNNQSVRMIVHGSVG